MWTTLCKHVSSFVMQSLENEEQKNLCAQGLRREHWGLHEKH